MTQHGDCHWFCRAVAVECQSGCSCCDRGCLWMFFSVAATIGAGFGLGCIMMAVDSESNSVEISPRDVTAIHVYEGALCGCVVFVRLAVERFAATRPNFTNSGKSWSTEPKLKSSSQLKLASCAPTPFWRICASQKTPQSHALVPKRCLLRSTIVARFCLAFASLCTLFSTISEPLTFHTFPNCSHLHFDPCGVCMSRSIHKTCLAVLRQPPRFWQQR